MTTLSIQEVEALTTAIDDALTDNFAELLRIAKLDPKVHLRFADWSGVHFSGCDLRGFDFTGARLIGCDFTDALITGARFDQAEIARVGVQADHPTNLRVAKDWKEFTATWQRQKASPRSLAARVSDDQHLPEGAVFQDAPFAPEMVVIPPGMAGRREDDLAHCDDGTPVVIPHALAVGRYPVSMEEWNMAREETGVRLPEAFMQPVGLLDAQGSFVRLAGGCSSTAMETIRSSPGRSGAPVFSRYAGVHSLEDARAYVKWLAHRTGQAYRLLSEAEWKYVSHQGSNTARVYGASDGQRQNVFGLYDVEPNGWFWHEKKPRRQEITKRHRKTNDSESKVIGSKAKILKRTRELDFNYDFSTHFRVARNLSSS